ncbi:MAG: phosphonoacetaldehyde hydrolase, partial [Nanoarchaeota archaeon]|nr:phosphonoacetaldehyde hydrolase [Nanoarchaeota archaeon]
GVSCNAYFSLDIREARVPMGLKKDVHIKEFLGLGEQYKEHPLVQGVVARWEEHFGKVPTEEDAAEIFKYFVPAQMEVLAKHADLIPGTLETVACLREQGIKIGSTTGYMGSENPEEDMVGLLLKEAEKRGYIPDVSVCATGHVAERDWSRGTWKHGKTHLPQARPAPWMCLENTKRLNIYPPYKCVKVDDTVDGVLEGVNAGMWTIGLIQTSSDMGLTEAEVLALPENDVHMRLKNNYRKMTEAGATYVVDGIWNVPEKIKAIQRLMNEGIKP